MRFKTLGAFMAAALLSGCLASKLPSSESMTVAAPSGTSLPLKARVLLSMGEADLARSLVVEITEFRNQEAGFKEGAVMEGAAKDVLRQVFALVETNQPAIRPQLVVKVTGKARYSRRDNMLKIGCTLDLFQADGAALGTFVARWEPKDPVDYNDAIPPSYRACFKQAADSMIRSPALQRMALGGFPEPHPAGYASFIQSLGLKP